MRRALRLSALALLLLAMLCGGGLWALLTAALQQVPAVVLGQDPAPEDVARVLALARAHDPRRARPGAVNAVLVGERDIDLLLNHAAAHRLAAAMRVDLENQGATLMASLHLPANPFGRWLNLRLRWRETGGLPALVSLRAGGVPLPGWLGERLLQALARRAGVWPELELAAEVVQHVGFDPEHLSVVYAWRRDSAERLVGALLPPADQERLHAYSNWLVEVAARQPPGWTVSLARLVGPAFELAAARSGLAGADAAAENRAALAVLALYANGRGLDTLLPLARDWPRPRPLQVQLAGRDDFPRHLLISAVLAAEGGGPISRAIGLYKEVADAQGGSGFSFNDMAANRAGTRLGELAVAAPRRLQAALAGGVHEGELMPAWADLPEFMPQAEFQRRYGGVGAPAYLAMMAEIDKRVGALPWLR